MEHSNSKDTWIINRYTTISLEEAAENQHFRSAHKFPDEGWNPGVSPSSTQRAAVKWLQVKGSNRSVGSAR